MSFLHIDMAEVETLPQERWEFSYSTANVMGADVLAM